MLSCYGRLFYELTLGMVGNGNLQLLSTIQMSFFLIVVMVVVTGLSTVSALAVLSGGL